MSRRYLIEEDDAPYLEAWNRLHSGHEDYKFRLELPPKPFMGPRDANLVILQLNPGIGSGNELDDFATPGRLEAVLANLEEDPRGHVHPYLTPMFSGTEGGDWYTSKLRALKEASGLSFDDLAHRILQVEFHGYNSKKWKPLPVTLPGQRLGFELVSDAAGRGAVIIATRGVSDWKVAVPVLSAYPNLFTTSSVQNASISARNVPVGFEMAVQALQAG